MIHIYWYAGWSVVVAHIYLSAKQLVWIHESMYRGRFIESKTFTSNRENIEIYYINLDVFSIGIELFAFNEPDSGIAMMTLFVLVGTTTLSFAK